MKSLQPQDLRLPAGTHADVQQVNALKTLKNPAHGGTTGWFIESLWGRFVQWRRIGDEATARQDGTPINREP
jgi:hypothetical protein